MVRTNRISWLPTRTVRGGTIGEEDDLGRDLRGEAQQVGGVGAGGLEPDAVLAGERARDGLRSGGHDAQHRMRSCIVIEPAGQPAQDARADEPGEHLIHSIPAAKVEEITRAEHRTPAGPPNPS